MAALRGRLAQWQGQQPDLVGWSEAEVLDGLAQLGIVTDRAAFTAMVAAKTQTAQEEDWLAAAGVGDENLQVFVWLAVRDLWQRWEVPHWPLDRLGRMFAYLLDAEYAAEYAGQAHAPTGLAVFAALDDWLAAANDAATALQQLVEPLGMPVAAWPGQMLDAMAEWLEFGNIALAERGAAFMARALGQGHAQIFLATALVAARMLDRAQAAALQVPLEAPLQAGFAELCAHLCLGAGDPVLADAWLRQAEAADPGRSSERTYAAEAVHDHLEAWRRGGRDESLPVPDPIRAAARQAAAQSAYYAWMAFAGDGASSRGGSGA